jgi:hypothetical protein
MTVPLVEVHCQCLVAQRLTRGERERMCNWFNSGSDTLKPHDRPFMASSVSARNQVIAAQRHIKATATLPDWLCARDLTPATARQGDLETRLATISSSPSAASRPRNQAEVAVERDATGRPSRAGRPARCRCGQSERSTAIVVRVRDRRRTRFSEGGIPLTYLRTWRSAC